MPKSTHRMAVKGSSNPSIRLERLGSADFSQMPFGTTLSLDPLIEYWMEMSGAGDESARALFPRIESYLTEHPSLRGSIGDARELRDHYSFLKLLTTPLFASAFDENVAAAIIVPFEYRVVYSTAAFKRLFTQEADVISGRVNLDLRTFTFGKTISAYLHVLRSVYGVDISFEYPVTFTTEHPETGLDLHHKIETDLRFVRINTHGNPPPLSEGETRRLLAHVSDLLEWMNAIPPSSFEFYGFSVIRAYDVTKEKMVGLLHRDLVEEKSLVSRRMLPDIEDHVRTLLQLPHVELGLAMIDSSDVYLLNEPEQPLVNTFFSRSRRYDVSVLRDSFFERCLTERSIQVADDLRDAPSRSAIEDDMLRWGVRSLVASPLFDGDRALGILYLWSHKPSSLSALDGMKLIELLPIFAASIRRIRRDMQSRVQKVIMGQYTAIHPTVEWRFQQAALHSIRKQERGGPLEVEPIVFENVYPLFAATDIRASSEHRNEAIRQDLLDHLDLAFEILSQASGSRPIAMFHHLLARIRRYQHSLKDGLASSDEAAVRDFLQRDLEPMLISLQQLGDGLEASLDEFHRSADPDSGALYRRSRAFENSVQQINQTASEFLDAEQARLQPAFPHYFEKHQTDGVDFTMYVGASLLENGGYDPIFVNVLRLWQLMVMCGVALHVRSQRSDLQVPLETTHLVLVQNSPINIRYRFDETRFDVDGPHHVRFEIMKQRVEKANLQGSKERLTQPDRLAIVYSQDREAREYSAYLEYLERRGFISSEIENLRLDDLQGMKGLRALRVSVAPDSAQALPEIDPRTLPEAVKSLDLPD